MNNDIKVSFLEIMHKCENSCKYSNCGSCKLSGVRYLRQGWLLRTTRIGRFSCQMSRWKVAHVNNMPSRFIGSVAAYEKTVCFPRMAVKQFRRLDLEASMNIRGKFPS